MSLLKRFGAMGSSSRKKTKKDSHLKKKRWQSRFRTTLFLQPLTILITSFAIILLVFNVLLKLFLAEEAFTAIQNQYDTLDALYVGEDLPKISDGNIFETTYAIVDEKFDIKYISASTYDLKSKFLRKSLITFQITSRLIGLMMNLIIVRSILKRSRSMIRLIWLRCKNILVPFQKVISSKIVMTVSRKTIMSLSLLMSLRLRTLKPISITFCFR